MGVEPVNSMTLSEERLGEIDHVLLDYLNEGRVTPAYARMRIIDEEVREDISGQYLSQRLIRFSEHDHAENLYDTGLYELRDDPRTARATIDDGKDN